MSKFMMYSGHLVDFTNFNVHDINIDDIAHHLTKQCRFGNSLEFDIHYSVAAHSINMYYYAKELFQCTNTLKAILLHDASEAYLTDIPSGLKAVLSDYKELETKIQSIIYHKYNVIIDQHTEDTIQHIDKSILLDEFARLKPAQYNKFKTYSEKYKALDILIEPDRSLYHTKRTFLSICRDLGIGD